MIKLTFGRDFTGDTTLERGQVSLVDIAVGFVHALLYFVKWTEHNVYNMYKK